MKTKDLTRLSLALAATSLLAAAPLADTIVPTEGDPITGVEIEEEGLDAVSYKDGGTIQTIPSERVVSVRYERFPREIDQAETAALDGDLAGAVQTLEDYLIEIRSGEKKEKRKWAAPYASRRLLEFYKSMGAGSDMILAADKLIEHHSKSRYLPQAYLLKAEAQADLGKLDQANETLTEFQTIVQRQGLSRRWKLECDLALILTDTSLAGPQQREQLDEIIKRADKDYPVVKNRAALAKGESLVEEATEGVTANAELLGKAKTLFQRIADDWSVEDEVKAGAYTGLGDCLFNTRGNDAERLMQAGMDYMRVVVSYKEHSRYVAKSMFYAARCFDQRGTTEDKMRSRDLDRRLISEFPSSTWADEAKKFL